MIMKMAIIEIIIIIIIIIIIQNGGRRSTEMKSAINTAIIGLASKIKKAKISLPD